MATGTRIFGLHETMLEPRALTPPPVRHALLAFVVALASILHIGTAGWSEIHNGAEGTYASGAREMLQSGNLLVPQHGGIAAPDEPPALYWLGALSFQVFGVNAMAARVPIAFAMVASIALTFLIGERLAGYWRGFVAALIHLCSGGAFIWGRIVTPEPVAAALIAAAVFCGVCGYQQRRTRRWWFAGWWLCTGLAYLTKGASAILVVVVIFLLLSVFFREARLRFQTLLHWTNVVPFVAVICGWHLLLNANFAGWLGAMTSSPWLLPFREAAAQMPDHGVSPLRFVAGHFAWWFPAVLLVLPAAILAWRKIIRPQEIEAADALPLCWMAAGFLPLLLMPLRQEYHSITMWSAFALWAASAWDRMRPSLRLAGIGLAAAAGVGVACVVGSGGLPFSAVPMPTAGALFGSIPLLLALLIAVFSAAAAYLSWRNRERLAIAVLMLGMGPVGLAMADGMARLGPQFSLARAAQFLETRLGDTGEVMFEGSNHAGSSLGFYLHRPFFLVGQSAGKKHMSAASLSEEQAIEKMAAPEPVYLIIHKDRVPFWQERLTARFHIYHQVTTCGPHVVINNHP